MSFDKKRIIAVKKQARAGKWRGLCVSAALSLLAAGCATQDHAQLQPQGLAAPKKAAAAPKYKRHSSNLAMYRDNGRLTERSCLERGMFFESNHSSRDGLIAVGTVIMNRVHSSEYPDTICGVVGQKSQFAPGVLTRRMDLGAAPQVADAADAVLRGERSRKLKNTLYFHTAGLSFPYNNMHYVLVAGGNSFYEKRRPDGSLANRVNDEMYDVAYAYAQDRGEALPASAALNGAVGAGPVRLASANGETAAVEQAVYHPGRNSAADIVAQANASLRTPYDNNARPAKGPFRAGEAQAEPVSYAPSVPVPQLKEAAAAGDTNAARPAPHFMPISAPQMSAGNSGAIMEAGGRQQQALASYKAPDDMQAGQVGAALLGSK